MSNVPSLQDILSDEKFDINEIGQPDLIDEMNFESDLNRDDHIISSNINESHKLDPDEFIDNGQLGICEAPSGLIRIGRIDRLKRKFAFVKKAYSWVEKFKIVDIVGYGLVFGLLIFVTIPTEKKDLFCPDMAYNKDKSLCRDGNGGIYYHHQSKADDTVNVSIEKIRKIIGNNKKLVKWRRCLIFAILSTLAIFVFIFHRFPRGLELLISVFCITLLFYLSFNFYGFHHDDHVNNAIYGNLNKIETELENYDAYPQVARSEIKVPQNVADFLE